MHPIPQNARGVGRLYVFIFAVVLMFSAECFASVVVSSSSPAPYSTDPSPVHFVAWATTGYPITGWHIYVDGTNMFGANNLASINVYLTISQGPHQVAIRAWDSTGAYGTLYEQITVQGTFSLLPTPPSTSKIFSNLDDTSGWGSCNASNCAGGSGTGSYWMAQFQTTPSLDGASMELYNSGQWADALWWKKLGANDWASHFLWDFYVWLDNASLTGAQALEFDVFQFLGGYNYMIGSQCNYAAGFWDIWDENHGKWIHAGIPCLKFSPGTWHHIQWYMQRVPNTHNYTFATLNVDGAGYTVNATYSAAYIGWSDNFGAQYQVDVNGTGAGYHEWIDKSKLTIW
jgi:hypothetical protein